MTPHRIGTAEAIGTTRETATIVVAAATELSPDWLTRLRATSPADAQIAIEGPVRPELERRAGELALTTLDSGGLGTTLASAGDLVILAGGTDLPADWFERLAQAAYARSPLASASALVPSMLCMDGAEPNAEAVARSSLRLRPRLRAPGGQCVYVRREALELAGPLDSGFGERCLAVGLGHVLADDVLAAGPAAGLLGLPSAPVTDSNPSAGTLSRALVACRDDLAALRITIDGRELRGPTTGIQVATLELIGALSAREELRLSVLLGPNASSEVREAIGRLRGVVVSVEPGGLERADLVHRPSQVSTPADLAVLAQLADRIVVTHHDLIGFHNPSYFRDDGAWLAYREITRAALAVADGVVFGSGHARDEALAEDLVEAHRAYVVPHGVDHNLMAASESEVPPALIASTGPFLLSLGTDLRHKNRLFALRLLAELRERGWAGRLVFAGPTVVSGSTRADERRFLERWPQIGDAVTDLGPVSEPEKSWLLEHAALVLYPTVVEGFGFIPFEAAERGTPCLWAPVSALSEVLPVGAAGIVPWDASATAPRALALIHDAEERAAQLRAIRDRAAGLRWAETARRLVDVYRQTCTAPASPAGARERASGLMREGLSEDALRLVGPDGALPRELERPLLALAARPRLSQPIFALMRTGYTLATRRAETKRTG